jgi:hypothetical protein
MRILIFAGSLLFTARESLAVQLTLTDDTWTATNSLAVRGSKTTLKVQDSPTVDSFAFLRFDLGKLPAGATSSNVIKATLTLFLNNVATPGNINIFRAATQATPWTEATLTWNTQPGITVPVASGVSLTTKMKYVTIDVTSAVTSWLTTPASNNGLVISPGAGVNVLFDSKESKTTSQPPTLEVTLFGNLTGSPYVSSTDIVDSTITSSDLGPSAVTSTKIASNAVNDTHLANSSVTSTKIASNAVNSSHIVDGTITRADLHSGAILLGGGSQSGTAISSSLSFIGPVVGVNLGGDRGRVIVTGTCGIGSFVAGGGLDLDLWACYQRNSAPADPGPITLGGGVQNIRVPQNTRIPMSVSAMAINLPDGGYTFGLCAVSSSPASWSSVDCHTTVNAY